MSDRPAPIPARAVLAPAAAAQIADQVPVGNEMPVETAPPAIDMQHKVESNLIAMPDRMDTGPNVRVLPRRVQAKPGGSGLPRPPRRVRTSTRTWTQSLVTI